MRSFSKGHAMGGFRVGYAVLGTGVSLPLAPVGGVGAAAVAGALWAVENGAPGVARRREQVARERARLVDALGDRVAEGVGPYVWLEASAEELAAARVYVAPGTAWGSSGSRARDVAGRRWRPTGCWLRSESRERRAHPLPPRQETRAWRRGVHGVRHGFLDPSGRACSGRVRRVPRTA